MTIPSYTYGGTEEDNREWMEWMDNLACPLCGSKQCPMFRDEIEDGVQVVYCCNCNQKLCEDGKNGYIQLW